MKANWMHCIPVKHNCRVFYSSWVFWWIPALPKPWTRTSFNCRAAAAVAARAVPHPPLLSVALPLGRESAWLFLHTPFHLGPTTETTYRDASWHQLHYAEQVFVGAPSGNHILGSLLGSSPPSHSLTAQSRSAHHQMAPAASYLMDLCGELSAGCLLYF